MNKRDRKKIAEKIAKSGITAGDIKRMLIAAYDAGEANEKVSILNKGMTRALAYNVYWRAWRDDPDGKVIEGRNWLGAYNAITEFGEYGNFELWVEPEKKERPETKVTHQEPINPHADGLPF